MRAWLDGRDTQKALRMERVKRIRLSVTDKEPAWDAATFRAQLLLALEAAGCRAMDFVEDMDADNNGRIRRREMLMRVKRLVVVGEDEDEALLSVWHGTVRGRACTALFPSPLHS